MDVVYLLDVPDDLDRLRLLRFVREAMRYFDLQANASDAERCIASVQDRGWGILGRCMAEDRETVTKSLRQLLPSPGCPVAFNINTAERERRVKARRATKAGATPEEAFAALSEAPTPSKPAEWPMPVAKTAFALSIAAEGNPLAAAGNAHTIGRTSGQEAFYGQVIAFMVECCPWIEQPLKNARYFP